MAVVVGSLGPYFNGAEAARVRLPVADNPYCSIATYKARDVAEQAMSVSDSSGRPVIVINAGTLKDEPSYGRFLMAHECCHHSLGHVNRYREGRGAVGPQPFFFIAPALKQMELDADCCAVRLLRERQEADDIEGQTGDSAVTPQAPLPDRPERADNITLARRGTDLVIPGCPGLRLAPKPSPP
jgi:hypothetical protein